MATRGDLEYADIMRQKVPSWKVGDRIKMKPGRGPSGMAGKIVKVISPPSSSIYLTRYEIDGELGEWLKENTENPTGFDILAANAVRNASRVRVLKAERLVPDYLIGQIVEVVGGRGDDVFVKDPKFPRLDVPILLKKGEYEVANAARNAVIEKKLPPRGAGVYIEQQGGSFAVGPTNDGWSVANYGGEGVNFAHGFKTVSEAKSWCSSKGYKVEDVILANSIRSRNAVVQKALNARWRIIYRNLNGPLFPYGKETYSTREEAEKRAEELRKQSKEWGTNASYFVDVVGNSRSGNAVVKRALNARRVARNFTPQSEFEVGDVVRFRDSVRSVPHDETYTVVKVSGNNVTIKGGRDNSTSVEFKNNLETA